MVRVKRGNVARKRRKKNLVTLQVVRGAHSVLFRVNQQVMKALRYSYVGRKQKRIFKNLISCINAASRLNGIL
jgi:large subunit ribosomal protein L20